MGKIRISELKEGDNLIYQGKGVVSDKILTVIKDPGWRLGLWVWKKLHFIRIEDCDFTNYEKI